VVLDAPEALPPAERRRTGLPVRLALDVGLQALRASTREPERLATVFTSSCGDGTVIHELCEALDSAERAVSPTRFHNSVHNAPAGYWGIALRARAPSTSLCCFDWLRRGLARGRGALPRRRRRCAAHLVRPALSGTAARRASSSTISRTLPLWSISRRAETIRAATLRRRPH
jgi:hypothetical protein